MSFNGAVLIDPTGDFCLSSVDAFTTDVMTRTDKICPYGEYFVGESIIGGRVLGGRKR